jgi:hypothetical protein
MTECFGKKMKTALMWMCSVHTLLVEAGVDIHSFIIL